MNTSAMPNLEGMNNQQKRSARLRYARSLGTHTKDQFEGLMGEFDFRCVRCGVADVTLYKDHIKPIYQGGSDGIDNIQPLCKPCNSSKGPEDTNWVSIRRKSGWRE